MGFVADCCFMVIFFRYLEGLGGVVAKVKVEMEMEMEMGL